MDQYQNSKISKKTSLYDRFHSGYVKDEQTGCWNWGRSLRGKGYGALRVNGKTKIASRVSYTLHKGVIPDNMVVCHTCNNPKCVNPDHLYVGTYSDNTKQAVREGRQYTPHGELNNSAVLTEKEVLEIRKDIRSQRKIAADYGVSQVNVGRIKRREIWKHI